MNSLALMAMNMLQNRPDVMNNPKNKELIEVLRSGDDVEGQRIAKEICSQNGETLASAMTKVRQFFGFK